MKYLVRQAKPFGAVLSFVFILLLGVLDYLTGSEVSFSIFYLLPISLTAWFVGWRVGIAMSVVGAVSWFSADLLAGHIYSTPAIPYWNASVRLGFFLIVTYALTELRKSRQRQQELSEFIVHDLRAPLGNVMTGLQTFQMIAGDTLEPTLKNLIQMCLVSCDRMLILVNSLLDVARLDNGQMPLQLSEVSVKELVASALKQVAGWAAQKQLTLDYKLETDVETIYTDSG